jgi:hypothetical protein
MHPRKAVAIGGHAAKLESALGALVRGLVGKTREPHEHLFAFADRQPGKVVGHLFSDK